MMLMKGPCEITYDSSTQGIGIVRNATNPAAAAAIDTILPRSGCSWGDLPWLAVPVS